MESIDAPSKVPRILRLDVSGKPIGWINWQMAVCLTARDIVSWTMGDLVLTVRGGTQAATGERTTMDLQSIMACRGRMRAIVDRSRPPLSNAALFARDHDTCLYCGDKFLHRDLTRDHVVPRSRGGEDTWENSITACKRCNHHKADRLPEEVGMELLARPYVPNNSEYLALINSGRILADQADFLSSSFDRERSDRKSLYKR